MIEQLISAQGAQAASISDISKQPHAAKNDDVMRFNMELTEKKSDVSEAHLLQDVKVDSARIDSDLLQMDGSDTNPTVSNPLSRLDSSYKAIMNQMNDVPEFDKFLEMQHNDKAPAVRTNVHETVEKDPANEVQDMLEETRDLYKTAGGYSKEISKWHIKTQIWSANIKILTTVVSQASQGFKTLFRSAG